MAESEITRVQVTIRKFAHAMRELRKENSKAGRWLDKFCNTLQYQDLEDDPDPLALQLLEEARSYSVTNRRNGQIAGARKSLRKDGVENPTAEQIEERVKQIYGAEAISEEEVSGAPEEYAMPEIVGEPKSKAGPAKNSYGEFGNVKMTTAEFEKLVQAEGADRANELIEELSSYLASSGKRYKSHYATLLNWGRRKDKEGEPKRKFLTADEISRRNIEESKRQLDALMAHRSVAHG